MANTPPILVDRWQKNLQALREVDAPCAGRLADLVIPDTVQPAVGRDGSATWRICRDADHTEWFGRTSMPTVSAESLLTAFNPGLGNVMLPGIGTGLEAKLLAERLGRHRAVVVLETDPLNLALALRLWDMAAALRGRQIVLLVGHDPAGAAEKLLAFCRDHPGFDLPITILAWPWRTKAEILSYQSLIEDISGQLRQLRTRACTELLAQLQPPPNPDTRPPIPDTRHPTPDPRHPTPDALAVLTTVPGIVACRVAAWLADGAQAIGMTSAACWPAGPLTAGPLSGLASAVQLASSAPGTLAASDWPDEAGRRSGVQIILLEQCRHHWPFGDVDNPLISWLVSVDPVTENWQFPEGRNDMAVVSTDRQRERLAERGWPDSRVLRVPAFIGPKAFESPLDGSREGILLLADLPPEDPDKAGITLYSYRILWQVLRERLDRQGDAWSPTEAHRWLLAAQSATGIDLADATVQEEFLELIRNVLAPAVLLRQAAVSILDAGLPLRVAGRGWDTLDQMKGFHDGLADDPHRRLELLAGAKAAVVGNCRPGPAWVALEAAAAGAVIMARDVWPGCDTAALFEPGKQMFFWRTRQELVERLRGLLRHEASRIEMARQARQRARQSHAADVRLVQLLRREGTG